MKKYRLLAVVLFVSTLTFPAMHAFAHTYTTNFPLTENPISENGNWINGGKTGLDWQNIETTPGLAFGDWVSGSYNDPVATLTGTWGTNQTATGKVVCISSCPSAGHIQEVEVHLRTSISAHKITGYEFDFWASPGSNQQMAIVRWNGPINDFTYIARCTSGCAVVHNGDALTATAIGSTLTAYINGVQVMQATDSTFSGGSPGIGTDNAIAANNSSFGFSSFTATDLPPSSLLLNPGFEFGLVDRANLYNGGTANAVRKSARAHSGNFYAELTSASGNEPTITATDSSGNPCHSVAPGQAIMYGGWAKRVSGDGSINYNLAFCDANKQNYTPVNTTLTVVMSQFSGPVNAKWYDPTKGSYSIIPGSPFSNSGEKKLATPGKNSAGNSYWVL